MGVAEEAAEEIAEAVGGIETTPVPAIAAVVAVVAEIDAVDPIADNPRERSGLS